MKMFNMIGIGERAGSGVSDIYAVWDSQGWKEPTVEEKYNTDYTMLEISLAKNKRLKQVIKTSDKKTSDKKAAEKSGEKSGEKKWRKM